MRCRMSTAVCSIAVFLGVSTCQVMGSDTDDSVALAVDKLCDLIIEIPLEHSSIAAQGELPEHEVEIAAWFKMTVHAHQLFKDSMENHAAHARPFIRAYIDEILSRPGQEGFRLILAAEGVLFSVQNGARIQPRGEVWLACSRASAQYQMELIASDAKNRAALYQFVVWRGRNLNRNSTWTNIQTIVEHIKDDDDRVWYGRNFAFYALETGRAP
ncbi:hypothetical protein AB1L42_23470, partial [Thalassoglobus sp. JC818]|uniref:hypothetical protein n=1 Tax=Thalassoglobus sp. JC818 TaxID=3232136 RepID=UPI00345AB64E